MENINTVNIIYKIKKKIWLLFFSQNDRKKEKKKKERKKGKSD